MWPGLIFGHLALIRLICGHPCVVDRAKLEPQVRHHVEDERVSASGKMNWLINTFMEEQLLPDPNAKCIIFFMRKSLLYLTQKKIQAAYKDIEVLDFSGAFWFGLVEK